MSTTMPTIALPVTWKVLESSRNQAATSALGFGLNSTISAVRHRCLSSLLARNDESGHRSILLSWEHLDASDRQLLSAQSQKFVSPAREVLQNGSIQEKKLILSAVSDLDLTDSADILLEYVEEIKSPLRESAAECLLAMCERWGRGSRRTGVLTNSLRQLLVKKLHAKVLANSKIAELMDAWLSLIHWDDAQQRSLLQDPSHPAYARMVDRLCKTNCSSALQLLAGYFWRVTAPRSIQEIVLEKADPQLAIEMAQLVSDDMLDSVLERLRYSPPLASMMLVDISQLKIDAATKRRLLLMMAASREDFEWTLSTCSLLASGSSMESRQLASDMLLWSRRPSLEQFVRLLQADSLSLPGKQILTPLVEEIIGWLESPSIILRKAAAHVLQDFTLDELFKHVGIWPAQLCRIMANVVKRCERNVHGPLEEYLQNPAPKKRLAALQIVEWFQCAEILKNRLISMMEDPRLEVRVRLIDTLSSLNDSVLEEMIPRLLQDANTDIVDAAHRAIRRFERQKPVSM